MPQILAIAIALSIDALGIGISTGIRGIRFPLKSLGIITITGFFIITLSLVFGNILESILPDYIAGLIGSILLLIMGIWIILQTFRPDPREYDPQKKPKEIFSLLIKSLGITINIVRTPEYSDLNKSKVIEPKEAFYVGTALSIDSIGVCIATATTSGYNALLPALVLLFQLGFIVLGTILGQRLNATKINTSVLTVLSGALIILIGISNLISLA